MYLYRQIRQLTSAHVFTQCHIGEGVFDLHANKALTCICTHMCVFDYCRYERERERECGIKYLWFIINSWSSWLDVFMPQASEKVLKTKLDCIWLNATQTIIWRTYTQSPSLSFSKTCFTFQSDWKWWGLWASSLSLFKVGILVFLMPLHVCVSKKLWVGSEMLDFWAAAAVRHPWVLMRRWHRSCTSLIEFRFSLKRIYYTKYPRAEQGSNNEMLSVESFSCAKTRCQALVSAIIIKLVSF